MEHAPIYRSTKRLEKRSSPIPWRRTASLASAAVGVAMSGIALGYHGFSYATDSLGAVTVGSRAGDLQMPGFSVQASSQAGGHPDAITALSSALLAQIHVSPAVVQGLGQPFGPLPLPFPAQAVAAPIATPVAAFSELDLPFLGPDQVAPYVFNEPVADATAVVEDVTAEPLVAAEIVAAAPISLALAAEPEAVVASANIAVTDESVDEPAPVPDPPLVVTSDPTARPAAAVTRAPTPRPTPKPTPDPVPVPETRIVVVEKPPKVEVATSQDKDPPFRRPQPEVKAAPPVKQDPPRESTKPTDNNKPFDNKSKNNNNAKHGG